MPSRLIFLHNGHEQRALNIQQGAETCLSYSFMGVSCEYEHSEPFTIDNTLKVTSKTTARFHQKIRDPPI